MTIIEQVRDWAIDCHKGTNHLYDGKPYAVHLELVYMFGVKYSVLLAPEEIETALCACWTHDVIEDCRQTYNDVKKICGEAVAEVTYALTNEKGKTRKDRANAKYYEGIRQNKIANFVKICDRLANVRYSKENGSSMFEAYGREHNHFFYEMRRPEFRLMFDELLHLMK